MPESSLRTISPLVARRLAVASQRLSAPPATPTAENMLDVVRQIGCLQLDPISAVARSHQLVLWSRLGASKQADFDRLMWQDRALFEYWAHAASIVLTEDYPIHHALMRNYPSGDSAWSQRTRAWLDENDSLRQHILDEIRQRGPMLSREFTDGAKAEWYSSGWTSGRNVNQMLDYLWTSGVVVVAGRKGGQKLWDLAERWLPHWTPRELLSDEARVALSAEKALRALGVATERQIALHYTRGRYPGLSNALKSLERDGRIQRLKIADDGDEWAGAWYVHADTLPLLERIQAGEWQARTTLLSPFDNLICDRARTEQMFNFRFRIEIYVPKAKREFGYYVLPILQGDRLVGRIDPQMNRKAKELVVNAVYAEPDAPMDDATGRAVRQSIEDLAAFLGAKAIRYGDRVPDGWREALRA